MALQPFLFAMVAAGAFLGPAIAIAVGSRGHKRAAVTGLLTIFELWEQLKARARRRQLRACQLHRRSSTSLRPWQACRSSMCRRHAPLAAPRGHDHGDALSEGRLIATHGSG